MKKRADGRIQKKVKDKSTGKYLYFYGKTEGEVNRKILAYSQKREIGRSFSEVAAEWWRDAVDRLAYQSQKPYKPAMERAVAFFGDTPIKEIKPRDVSRFLQELAKKDFAQKTVSNHRLIVNLICRHAVIQGDLEHNPCADVATPKNLKKAPRKSATEEDEEKVKQSADVWLFPFVALTTGMRKGEILALQWRDVDFENNIIRVTKSIYFVGDISKIKRPKTEAGARDIPLLPILKEKLLKVKNENPDSFIFSENGKDPLSPWQYLSRMKQYIKTTGVTSTPHQLRHSFATLCFEAGIPIKSVQEVLGHKQISTTMDIYTDFRKKKFEDFSKLFS
jgi:integrase